MGTETHAAVIAALQAQRATLGDAAVERAIAALRADAEKDASGHEPQRLRQVSVLFVDVVESTKLLRALPVHEAPAALDAALTRFAALVRSHGGEVLRFTGDGLKAVFGTHGLRENEAEHAVRAGLAILEAAAAHARALRERHPAVEFAVRAGIHTGAVVLGGGAEADRTALGAEVHLAARLEQSAPVGRLRISRDTHAQVRGLFRVQAQPPLALKGLDEPLETFLVEGEAADAHFGVQRGIAGLMTPMVGRDTELAALAAAYAAARESRCVRVATVLADAGVGKTRLRLELLARLGLRENSRQLLQARAHPDSALQPYGLLRRLVARWLGIADDLDAATARTRLVAGLAPWLRERAELRAQAVGQLIGMDFGELPALQALQPRELRQLAFDALAEALQALARAAGTGDGDGSGVLAIVLDDLHWADAGSLAFVRQLARAAPVPMFVALFARPVLRELHPEPLAEGEAAAATIELRPLDHSSAPTLAAALLAPLPDAPSALHRLLVERSGGNPFYMEELLRMLIDDGVIDARRRPWRLARDTLDVARVPGTLVGVLQARLDALPAAERAALQCAAIVGPVFWDTALAAVRDAAPRALPALTARGLVQPRRGSAFADATEYAFGHQILHEVIYDIVVEPERRAGHGRVAHWFAARVAERPGEFLAVAAAHFERAGDSAQALEHYDRARADAQRRYAHEAQLAHCERALAQPALRSPMWRFQLLAARHNTLESMGRVEEAQRALDALRDYAEAVDDDAMRADCDVTLMLAADRAGDVVEAERLARQAVRRAEAANAPGPAALAHGELAWLAVQRGDHAAAERHLERGVPWARRAAARSWREGGYPDYEVQLRAIGIESLLLRQRFFEAARAVQVALDSLAPSRLRDRVHLLLQLARTQIGCGDLGAAMDAARRSAELAEQIEITRLRADSASQVAAVHGLLGAVTEQERLAEAAETLARSCDYAAGIASAVAQRAEAAQAAGQFSTACALWAEVAALYATLDVPTQRLDAQAGRVLASACLAGSDTAARAHTLGEVEALLAEADGDSTEAAAVRWPRASPKLLARAAQALQCAGYGERAAPLMAELRRRLDEQLAQAPDEAARARVVQAVPHWRFAATGIS